MFLPNELFQIPTPLNDLARRRKKSDETEGVDSLERQRTEGGRRGIRRDNRANGIDDLAAAHAVAANPRRDGIPVDERKSRAVIVHSDPRSAAQFSRTDYRVAIHLLFSRGEAGQARQLFIAVHSK